MKFTDLPIKSEYRSPQNNIAAEFLIPVLQNAVSYKRSVGFFSSSALIEISKGICALAKNGGTIELVASPYLSAQDEEAIRVGYENRHKIIENALLRELKTEHKEVFAEERLNLLANLIESGTLNIKIAFTDNTSKIGMYHEKLGLIEDSDGNKIAFSGSMNESVTALTKNYETTDVFCSWKNDFEKERVIQKEKAFAAIWGNFDERLKVMHFPSIEKAILDKYKRGKANFEIDEREQEKYIIQNNDIHVSEASPKYTSIKNNFTMPENLKLYDYQKFAIKSWQEKNYIGIFDMATGTGKTLTALSAISTLSENANGNFCVIILCPYIHLVTQWVEDIKKFNCKSIIGFGSSPQKNWKEKLENAIYKRNYKDNEDGFFCFITTVATFKSDFVQKQIKRIKKNILLVADEAHNLGSQNAQYYLDIQKYKFRLALSATLERHFDEKGTQRLYDFFGEKCIEYDLKRAIDEGYLTPYYYYPVVVSLDLEEREEYKKLAKEIANEIINDPKSKKKKLTERGKLLCIMRSRIISGCAQKIPALIEKLESYKDKNMILIYCGAVSYDEDIQSFNNDEITNRQIDKVIKNVYDSYKMKITRFTAMENIEQRESIKEAFSNGNDLQAIAAIKCLDEGVNIPSIKTAFILASSTNPKEYIQRRGRVLRLYKGKEFAEIYDFITLPFSLEDSISKSEFETSPFKTLAKNELERIKEFSSLAKNSYDSTTLINEITNKYLLKDFVQTEDYDYE